MRISYVHGPPKNGMVAVVNDVACRLLGFGCEELVGKNIDDIVASSGADLGTAVDQEDFEVAKRASGSGGGAAAAKVVVSGKVVRSKHVQYRRSVSEDFHKINVPKK